MVQNLTKALHGIEENMQHMHALQTIVHAGHEFAKQINGEAVTIGICKLC